MIGQTLSHFKITAKLGQGGMGEVYLAEDLDLKRTVALKVLPEALACDEERLQRFRREVEALAALDHPNIVTIYSIEEAHGMRFFAMQHVEGRELSAVIPDAGLELDRFLDLAIPLVDAISAAHDQGVVHRDLKPANVLVDRAGRVRVLDFGLAKLCPEVPESADSQLGTEMLTQVGTILGTVAYMSPEQAQGLPLDARSDVFSLGVVLHEMVTGERPFAGDNQVAVLSSIVKDTPQPVSEIKPELPRDLGRTLGRALEKDPDQRFQAARDLLEELRALKRETTASKILATGSAGAAQKIRPMLAGSLVAMFVLVALALLAISLDVGGVRDRLLGGQKPVATGDEGTPSIAVLPFENLSPDPNNEYFSHGMTEELVTKLTRIHRFRVRSTPLGWTPGEHRSVEDVGVELGVRYLLEGSVRKEGENVRIAARLVDTSSAFHLWSRDFDGTLEDVFAVQSETALQIATALDVALNTDEDRAVRDRPTEDPRAYDEYLRGWALIESFHIHQERSEERLAAAQQHFLRALEYDPDYPLALAGLALVESYTHYLGVDRSPARVQQAEAFAQSALALEPGLPEALVALGQVGWLRKEYQTSANYLLDALTKDPDNGYVWCELSAAWNNLDPPDASQGEHAARKAIHFQPGYTWAHLNLGKSLSFQGRYDESLEAYLHAIELNPGFRSAILGVGDSHLGLGNYVEALTAYEQALELRETPYLLAEIAALHSVLGNRDVALQSLERAFALGYDAIAEIEANPHFGSLRDDPAFVALLEGAH